MLPQHKEVLITFIEDATGAAMGTCKMPPEQLPESFELETTLHLDDAYWSVVHAEPRTRQEYTESGSLTLRLRKIEKIAPETVSFSQLDITEKFDDNLSLGVDDWISTTPLNAIVPNPESSGLPSVDAESEEVYRVASELSELRESISPRDDGVYCPVCHIANIDLGKLRTPCPRCGRALLQFGWE
ncbi:MAG: hypothetical protein ACTHK7_06775 [Aureliella sp.]